MPYLYPVLPLSVLWVRDARIRAEFEITAISPTHSVSLNMWHWRHLQHPTDPTFMPPRWDDVIIEKAGIFNVSYFHKETSTGYGTLYPKASIPTLNIDYKFKSYTQSFFRLDYFDSVIGEAQNLLFTEILTTGESNKPYYAEFTTKIDKPNYFLYWLKNDPIIQENGYRDVWMTGRFFNAKTGQIQQFFNTGDAPLSARPKLEQYNTLLKYTRIRLYQDYTYMISHRVVTMPTTNLQGVTSVAWDIIDSNSTGISMLELKEIRINPLT